MRDQRIHSKAGLEIRHRSCPKPHPFPLIYSAENGPVYPEGDRCLYFATSKDRV